MLQYTAFLVSWILYQEFLNLYRVRKVSRLYNITKQHWKCTYNKLADSTAGIDADVCMMSCSAFCWYCARADGFLSRSVSKFGPNSGLSNL